MNNQYQLVPEQFSNIDFYMSLVYKTINLRKPKQSLIIININYDTRLEVILCHFWCLKFVFLQFLIINSLYV